MPDRYLNELRALSRPRPPVLMRIWWSVVVLALIMLVGTFGFPYFSIGESNVMDGFFMTAITVTTVGYGEHVPLQHTWGARIFAFFIGFAGFGTVTFMFSSLTVFFLETDLNKAIGRRRMEKAIKKLHQHYILCGYGRVGRNIAVELESTGRHFVAIDENQELLETQKEKNAALLYLHGDASDDDTLLAADIGDARGLFAVTGDDSRNLMIVITAKQLNPAVRVVARCHEVRNIEKMRKAGADAIVSPDFTGGMRIASAMIRPHVVSFLDEMLRSEKNLRVEEVGVPDSFQPRELGSLALKSQNYLLLAVRRGADWVFNPPASFRLEPGQVVIAMASPQGRHELEMLLAGVA